MEQVNIKPITVDMATLLKYEASRTIKPLMIAALIPLLAVFTLTAVSFVPAQPVKTISLTLTTLGVAAGAILPFVFLIFDYWRSSYGANAYLTHTMPVAGGKIFWAKLTWSTLAYLVSLAVFIGEVFIMLFQIARNVGMSYSGLLKDIFTAAEDAPNWILFFGVTHGFIYVVMSLVTLFFSISVGFESRMQRFGKAGPVIIGVALYVIYQIVNFVFLLIPFGFEISSDLHFNSINIFVEGPSGNYFPIGILIPPLLFVIGLTWRTWVSWQKKISL